MSLPKTLFIGLANSATCWYRCALPANEIGADWIGIAQHHSLEDDIMYNGNLQEIPDFRDYEVVVIQQPNSEDWDKKIKLLQSEGIKVLYEIDDFVHGIKKIKDHRYQKRFHKKKIKEFQTTMSLCDGMICSTKFLSEQYKKYNDNQYICKVGIQTHKYDNIEFPDRQDNFIIGWAGGTGHDQAIAPWLLEVAKIIKLYDNVHFASIGVNYGDLVNSVYPGKGLTIPWVGTENLPYALTNFDAYIAPAHDSKYFKSKSNLRWLESSAVGLPGVVHPQIYLEAKDEFSALLADNAKDAADCLMELIEDRDLGKEIGANAQLEVQDNFDVSKTSEAWSTAILDIVNK